MQRRRPGVEMTRPGPPNEHLPTVSWEKTDWTSQFISKIILWTGLGAIPCIHFERITDLSSYCLSQVPKNMS